MSYARTGPTKFEKAFEYPPRPHAPWTYPQTGTGLPLPMAEPWDKMLFIAAGGSSEDNATRDTPASAAAHLIDVRGSLVLVQQRTCACSHLCKRRPRGQCSLRPSHLLPCPCS